MARILIVDDDQITCSTFLSLLDELGHLGDCALSVTEGLQKSAGRDFDLVLVSADMNSIDLDEAVQELKSVKTSPEVILLVGGGNSTGRDLAAKYGAWDYIPKPATLDKLSWHLKRALKYRSEKFSGNKCPTDKSWKAYKRYCERVYFRDLMERTEYDLNEAAEYSGLGVHSLYKYLKRNGIPTKKPHFRES
jgi:DNA-binding NtrC family response regulator